jgi:hypothetical protein
MTDTINRSTAGVRSTTGGAGGRGPRRVAGLAAIAALGVALLAGVVLSQRHQGAQPANSQAGSNPIAGAAGFIPDPFTYREDHRNPAGTMDWEQQDRMLIAPGGIIPDPFTYREDHRSPAVGVSAERQRFLEQNLWLDTSALPAPAVWRSVEEQRFLEWNIWLPSGAPALVPDPFTYREDHRGER